MLGILLDAGLLDAQLFDLGADLVAIEDKSAPLSDQELVAKLADKGLTLARRTVAKYREELGILPSNLRRDYK